MVEGAVRIPVSRAELHVPQGAQMYEEMDRAVQSLVSTSCSTEVPSTVYVAWNGGNCLFIEIMGFVTLSSLATYILL